MTPLIGGLFEGYGGLTKAVRDTLGGDLAWYSEIEPAANRVLAHHHPDVPNLGDITAVDWATTDPVDVLTGGFPCQDVSSAGRRAGLTPDSRSGLWTHMARAINVLRPRLVVIENVRGLLSADASCDVEPCPWCLGDHEGRPLRALGAVLGDLAVLGYDAEWHGLRAADAGAPHARYRVFIVARPLDSDSAELGRGAERGNDGVRAAGLVASADADPDGVGSIWPRRARQGRCGSAHHDFAPANSARIGRREGWAEPERQFRGPDAPVGGARSIADPDSDSLRKQPVAVPGRGGPPVAELPVLDWGDYGPAIQRWELILGRPAPAPTMTGKRGGQQLSPAFVEGLMGLPAGHVTDVPGLSRNDQLKLLGNGVVPQQAELALRHLLLKSEARSVA